MGEPVHLSKLLTEDNGNVLLNVSYIRANKENNLDDDYFEVIYKDKNDNVHMAKEPAECDVYIVKPEFRDFNYNKPQERIDRMNKYRVPIKDVKKFIASQIGEEGINFFNSCIAQREFGKLNQLYGWPYAFGCDFQPEYYYMKNWYEFHKLKSTKLSKCFLDIETDLIDYTLDLENIPNTAYSPVNLVTLIFNDTNEVYTFILKPYEPSRMGRTEEEYKERYEMYQNQKVQHEYVMGHLGAFIDDLHKSFDPIYGNLNYKIKDYNQEIELIADVFRVINSKKPNFCLCWNMRFDIQYLYYRIMTLGYTPSSIMCHPDFDIKRCRFVVDKSTYKLEKQYDFFYCSSYTQYICQMRLYGSIRKSQHQLRSIALNAIADMELRDKKVQYDDESNLTRFMYHKWPMAIKYNIKDVLLQMGIERKVNDVMVFYNRSHANMTPYNKIFKETHLLRNVREMYFEQQGWIQGNNINTISGGEDDRIFKDIDDDDDESTFKGAINADPIWNDRIGMKVKGSRSNNIFSNAMDYDMGAFYPSIKIASNMDPGTLVYKAMFDNDEFISGEFNNRSLNQSYYEKDKNGNVRKLDITGEAVNTYAAKNILTFGYNYLSLPSITSIADEIIKALKG